MYILERIFFKKNSICNWQKEEVSAELLTFHEVVNHMQEDEEEVIDDHRVITEVSSKETNKSTSLFMNS